MLGLHLIWFFKFWFFDFTYIFKKLQIARAGNFFRNRFFWVRIRNQRSKRHNNGWFRDRFAEKWLSQPALLPQTQVIGTTDLSDYLPTTVFSLRLFCATSVPVLQWAEKSVLISREPDYGVRPSYCIPKNSYLCAGQFYKILLMKYNFHQCNFRKSSRPHVPVPKHFKKTYRHGILTQIST